MIKYIKYKKIKNTLEDLSTYQIKHKGFLTLIMIISEFQVESDVNLDLIAEKSEKFSGSDLREICRNACMYRIRDHM